MSVDTAAQHPPVEHQRQRRPQKAEHAGFNDRLAVFITRMVSTMWAVYFVTALILAWMALGTWGPLRHVDPYPFAFLLFLGNVTELMLLSIILVGQAVLGQAADRRALRTYRDAESILRQVSKLHRHLIEQDHVLNRGVSLVEHQPHPWIEKRSNVRPVRVSEQYVGINGRIAAGLTRAVGTMWAFYAAAVFQFGWMGLSLIGVIRFDPYPFAFMLFISSLLQLILEFVVMVGQDVLGKAGDRRAEQTLLDAEAILHECVQLDEHLILQDSIMVRLAEYIEQHAGPDHPVRAIQPTQQPSTATPTT